MSCHSRTTELNFQSILLIELIETSHILLINLKRKEKNFFEIKTSKCEGRNFIVDEKYLENLKLNT